MEAVVGVGIGWFTSERHTQRPVVYCPKESAKPGRASPCRASKAWDGKGSECRNYETWLIQGFTTVASYAAHQGAILSWSYDLFPCFV